MAQQCLDTSRFRLERVWNCQGVFIFDIPTGDLESLDILLAEIRKDVEADLADSSSSPAPEYQ